MRSLYTPKATPEIIKKDKPPSIGLPGGGGGPGRGGSLAYATKVKSIKKSDSNTLLILMFIFWGFNLKYSINILTLQIYYFKLYPNIYIKNFDN
ncbi:hypothetical protein SAMN06265371_10592 [Lutibacter agarilyticus]|uniref:Uncharacterized protein n=1 Tax=Lutibacter agarilyticus TaxID=1109740 RepID=A0A238X9J5_9FLAO|nr:hypothetical protein SAMN06265371_10592 [Lutibacter agarilyticus]